MNEETQLETDNYKAVRFYSEANTPKIVKLVMKFSGGTIKKQKHAEYMLLGFIVFATVVSFYLFINTVRPPSPPADKIIWVAGP